MFQQSIGIKHEGIQRPKLVGTFYTYSLLKVLYACEVVYIVKKILHREYGKSMDLEIALHA